jgi:hypothetical protein
MQLRPIVTDRGLYPSSRGTGMFGYGLVSERSPEVLRPAAACVRDHVATSNSAAAEAILAGVPVVSLEFAVAGDQNVAEVALLNGHPVGSDYH